MLTWASSKDGFLSKDKEGPGISPSTDSELESNPEGPAEIPFSSPAEELLPVLENWIE